MHRAAALALFLLPLGCAVSDHNDAEPTNPPRATSEHMTPRDRAQAEIIAAREDDWRCAPVIYQIFLDRFAPPTTELLNHKIEQGLYDTPRILKKWSQPARVGKRLPKHGVREHEIEFWGGDLTSMRTRLDHLQTLDVDVVYLNPIHEAWTNHKYDALDWAAISPEYGTHQDLTDLATDLHARDMRLILDGVFNHMGANAPIFKHALADENSPYRHWFYFGPEYARGYRAWFGSPNLPEIRLDHPDVKAHVWANTDSVVRQYLRDGADGWRLDVAYDYGLVLLTELTAAAHQEKPDAWIVGEVWNYPQAWVQAPPPPPPSASSHPSPPSPPPLDGVMNMYARRLIMEFLDAKIQGARMGRMLDEMYRDMGIEPALRSWLVLDNHDTPRLKTMFPREADRRLAQIMQMTLPGAPVIYYGAEAAMEGDRDPEMRGPMDWNAVEEGNPELDRLRQLLDIRQELRALRVGDFRMLESDTLLAYQRRTGRAMETVTILINPTPLAVTELISLADSMFMNAMPLKDALANDDTDIWAHTGTVELTVPARGAMILVPTDDVDAKGGYSPYKRVY